MVPTDSHWCDSSSLQPFEAAEISFMVKIMSSHASGQNPSYCHARAQIPGLPIFEDQLIVCIG